MIHNKFPVFSLQVFNRPDQWIFKKGLPPPLSDSRFWVRGIHGTLIVAALGAIAGTLNSILLAFMNPSPMDAHALGICCGAWQSLVAS